MPPRFGQSTSASAFEQLFKRFGQSVTGIPDLQRQNTAAITGQSQTDFLNAIKLSDARMRQSRFDKELEQDQFDIEATNRAAKTDFDDAFSKAEDEKLALSNLGGSGEDLGNLSKLQKLFPSSSLTELTDRLSGLRKAPTSGGTSGRGGLTESQVETKTRKRNAIQLEDFLAQATGSQPADRPPIETKGQLFQDSRALLNQQRPVIDTTGNEGFSGFFTPNTIDTSFVPDPDSSLVPFTGRADFFGSDENVRATADTIRSQFGGGQALTPQAGPAGNQDLAGINAAAEIKQQLGGKVPTAQEWNQYFLDNPEDLPFRDQIMRVAGVSQ